MSHLAFSAFFLLTAIAVACSSPDKVANHLSDVARFKNGKAMPWQPYFQRNSIERTSLHGDFSKGVSSDFFNMDRPHRYATQTEQRLQGERLQSLLSILGRNLNGVNGEESTRASSIREELRALEQSMAKEHFIHTAEAIPTVEETLRGYFRSPRCYPTKTEGTALREQLFSCGEKLIESIRLEQEYGNHDFFQFFTDAFSALLKSFKAGKKNEFINILMSTAFKTFQSIISDLNGSVGEVQGIKDSRLFKFIRDVISNLSTKNIGEYYNSLLNVALMVVKTSDASTVESLLKAILDNMNLNKELRDAIKNVALFAFKLINGKEQSAEDQRGLLNGITAIIINLKGDLKNHTSLLNQFHFSGQTKNEISSEINHNLFLALKMFADFLNKTPSNKITKIPKDFTKNCFDMSDLLQKFLTCLSDKLNLNDGFGIGIDSLPKRDGSNMLSQGE